MAGPFYIPSESGVSLGGAFNAYYRLKITHSYDPVSNESTLVLIPQLKCTGAYTPYSIVFRGGASDVGMGRVYVDGVSRGTIGTTSGLSFRGIGTTMSTWVGVQKDGAAFTMTVSGIKHSDTGAKTVSVYYEKFMVYDQTFNQTSGVVQAVSATTLTLSQTRQFTLSVSASNCSVSVTKGGSTVNPGANAVTYGDVLTITAAANTGYNTPSLTVTGATKSGNTYTVTGPVTVTATSTKKSYTLTISQGTNSTIKVTRNGSVLGSGATIYHFDQLVITMTANSGYHLTSATVSGATLSGGVYTVIGAVTVTTVAEPNDHTLHLTQGAHTTLAVTLDGSPLSNNANVQTGDRLVVSASADTGYNTPTVTVTGATKSGNEYVVGDADVTVASSTTPQAFTLAITQGENSTVTVTKNGSPVASGGTIYYDDELIISAVPDSGYELSTFTVNGNNFISGGVLVVSGNVAVVTVAEELVGAYLKLADEVARYTAYIKKAADEIARYIPYIQTTNGWVKY